MKATVTTIPELLVQCRGNQTAVSRIINSNRTTVRKYARDFDAKQHAIVNGTLLVHRGYSGSHKKESANAANLVRS